MNEHYRRPLPVTPLHPDQPYVQNFANNVYNYPNGCPPRSSADIYAAAWPSLPAGPYLHYTEQLPTEHDDPSRSLLRGTLLHKGFYDLLALIPSPQTASRFLWGTPKNTEEAPTVAGPRYENLAPKAYSPPATPASPKRGRRLSKDMVSKPMNFV